MRNVSDLLKMLLDRSNSLSSKSFFLLVVTFIVSLLFLCLAIVLLYDVAYDGKIDTDLLGISALIGSLTTTLGVAGFTKVQGEKNDTLPD